MQRGCVMTLAASVNSARDRFFVSNAGEAFRIPQYTGILRWDASHASLNHDSCASDRGWSLPQTQYS